LPVVAAGVTKRDARLAEALGVLVGMVAGQPVTVKVTDATVPLWRPLTWKMSRRPG
jgi:hypothetical protein